MIAAHWTYLGTMIGAACCFVHVIYCRVAHEKWPPAIRLLATFLAGAGTMSGLQLAAVVASPPTVPPATIVVDDYRTTLGIGVLAMFVASAWALYDNWKAISATQPQSPSSSSSASRAASDARAR
jgi:hypothetical protein